MKSTFTLFNDQNSSGDWKDLNWAGRIKEYSGNYLYINDANFASGKANLYVKEKADIKLESKGNTIEQTLKINYEDPKGYNDQLNRNYRDALRIYVPKGSVMISTSGSVNNKVDTYEEFNKTVFDTFMFTYAQNKSEFTITYRLPGNYKKGDTVKLLLQKQPGVESIEYKIDAFGKKLDTVNLRTDRELEIKI